MRPQPSCSNGELNGNRDIQAWPGHGVEPSSGHCQLTRRNTEPSCAASPRLLKRGLQKASSRQQYNGRLQTFPQFTRWSLCHRKVLRPTSSAIFSGWRCCRRNPRVFRPQDIPRPRRRPTVAKLSRESEDQVRWLPGFHQVRRQPNEREREGLRLTTGLRAPSFGVVDGVPCLVHGRTVGQVPHVVHEHGTWQRRASSALQEMATVESTRESPGAL